MFKEITPDMLGNRDDVRKNATRSGEEYRTPISNISVRDGFNGRTDYGDLEELANSIQENGQQIAGRVDVMADGTYMLTDGHRRFKAFQIIAKRTGEVPMMKVILNDRKTTEEQRLLQMFTTQDNKPLEPYEVAEIIRRLINMGYTQATVAKKIGKTASYVSLMLDFANDSEAIKAEVREGNMSIATARAVKKAVPSASARIQAMLETKEAGKKLNVENLTGKASLNPRERVNQLEALLEDILTDCPSEIADKIKAVL